MCPAQGLDATSPAPKALSEVDPTLPQHRPEQVADGSQDFPQSPTPLKLTVTIKPPDPIHDVPCITQVRPDLFIGNYAAAKRPDLLEKHRITAIVSLKATDCLAKLGAIPQFTSLVPKERHLWITVSDQSKSNLLIFFEYICDFIDKMIATPPKLWNGKPNSEELDSPSARGVLIHCQAGISRSATATIAYLMRKEKLGRAGQAIAQLKQIHPRVEPNQGFRRQLEIWPLCDYTPSSNNGLDYLRTVQPQLVYLTHKKLQGAEKQHYDRLTAFMDVHVYDKDTADNSRHIPGAWPEM